MKLVIIGVGAFIASLVGTTAVLVVRADPLSATEEEAHAPGDSTLAAEPFDVTHTAGNDAESSPAVSAPPDSIELDRTSADVPAPTEQESPTLAAPADTVVTEPTAAAQDAPAPPKRTQEEREQAAIQLARIVSAMRPDDAAAVLKHMSDDEVIDVLKNLNARQAAGVLAGLSAVRAAAISQRLLTRCERCGGFD